MLGEALRRNLYRKGEPAAGQVAALCGYLRREAAILDRAGAAALLSGRVAFGPPPVLEGE
jgi:hypothetical protein